jgi:carbonic anhydrase/acetyltransferase-like protein (isoleucine patch superfamily)
MIYPYKGKYPKIADSAFIADFTTITGDVEIGEESSVWFNSVIRGDVAPTVIGKKVNIQDNSVLHQSPNNPLVLEDEVTIGHQVILHSCEIGEGAFIGAGSLVPQGKKIPPNTLAFGRPAKVIRELNEHDISEMNRIYTEYAEKAQYYKSLQK